MPPDEPDQLRGLEAGVEEGREALARLVLHRWTRRFGSTGLELAPLAWVATELLRAYTFFRFPWCLLGYSQAEFPALIQIAAWSAV